MKLFPPILSNIWRWYGHRGLGQKLMILLVFLGVGVGGYWQVTKESDEPTYEYATVTRQDLTQVVSETGEVTTSNKVDIHSTITGTVTEVPVTNGQAVARGDTVFTVVSSATEAERSKAWSDYLGAQATLQTAQATQYSLQATMFTEWDQFNELAQSDTYKDLDSANRALPEFHTPEKEWLAAETKYKTQTQVIAQAQAARTKAWLDYQATVDGPIKATADGVVANLHVAVGQQVAADDLALILKTPSQIWVEVGINENDITQVKSDQPATITVDALNAEFPATVVRVDEFGTEVADVMVYYVYLTLQTEDPALRPGMTAQVDITTQAKPEALAIPTTAIKPYQGEQAVQIMDPESESVIYQPVTLGIRDDTYTEVVAGLSEGQEIIVSSSLSEENQSGGFFRRPD